MNGNSQNPNATRNTVLGIIIAIIIIIIIWLVVRAYSDNQPSIDDDLNNGVIPTTTPITPPTPTPSGTTTL